MTRHAASALALLATASLSACTCREPAKITGEVVDWWGHEVPGAKVEVQGGEAITADERGRFTLPMAGTTTVTVTRDGYFPRTTDVVPMSLESDYVEKVEVVPVPPGPGVHVVGPDRYVSIDATPVERLGDDAHPYQGVRTLGSTVVTADPLKVVFHAPLKLDDGAVQDLSLHRLQKVEEGQTADENGVLSTIPVGLWVSGGTVEFERKPLGDDGSFAFRADDLEPGPYAFATLGLLEPKTQKEYDKIPPVIRTAYTFTVKAEGDATEAPAQAEGAPAEGAAAPVEEPGEGQPGEAPTTP